MTNHTPAKPIQPGCMVMILPCGSASADSGFISTAVKRFNNGKGWVIDPVSPFMEIAGYEGVNEAYLLRIDDPDLQKQIESEREKEAV